MSTPPPRMGLASVAKNQSYLLYFLPLLPLGMVVQWLRVCDDSFLNECRTGKAGSHLAPRCPGGLRMVRPEGFTGLCV